MNAQKIEWVKNTKTGTQAWVVRRFDNWNRIEVMTLSGKAYWKIENTAAI